MKCVELFLNNPDKINKEIIFIEDYLKVKKVDIDFLNSRIDSICEEIIIGSTKDYNVLIMELLDPSLERLFQSLNKRFSIKTTCILGIQMLDRIEYIHRRKIINRDIKPDKFAIGRGKNPIFYMH